MHRITLNVDTLTAPVKAKIAHLDQKKKKQTSNICYFYVKKENGSTV